MIVENNKIVSINYIMKDDEDNMIEDQELYSRIYKKNQVDCLIDAINETVAKKASVFD